MGAFATDQTLSDPDLELLLAAQRGDKPALRRVCDRFKTPLLALVLRNTGNWERAAVAVDPLLEQLCRELLAGELMAVDWATRALALAAQQSAVGQRPEENGSGLEGLGAIARVVKRRALRSLLPQLPLPELTTLLLAYLENRRPEELVGLVAATPPEAAALLVNAHQRVQSELKLVLHSGGVKP